MILPPELVKIRRTKTGVYPQFLDEDHTGLAKTLSEIYREHADRRRGDLQEALSHAEELGFDFKHVRGLAYILDGFCVFGTRSVLNPAQVRPLLFDEAARSPVTTEEERRAVVERVARQLNASPRDVEESMYADLEDETQLTDFRLPQPFELIQRYNFALACSVLAHAVLITVEFTGKGEDLRQAAESLGEADARGIPPHGYVIKLKASRHVSPRGAKVEQLLGRLIRKSGWKLAAELAYPPRLTETKPLAMEERTHGGLLKADPEDEELVIEVPSKLPKRSRLGAVIVVGDEANRLGVTDRELLAQIEREGARYTRLGGVLYDPATLEAIRADLKGLDEGELGEFKSLLKGHGAKNPVAVLESLGYVVEPEGKTIRVYRMRRK